MKSAIIIACCFAAAFGSMVGSKSPLTPEDVKSAEFRGALDMATLEMNRVTNQPSFHAVASFVEGTKQVVAGVLYEFNTIFKATNCENRESENLSNLAKCVPLNLLGASEIHCSFKVLYQPWIVNAEYRVISVPSCFSPRQFQTGPIVGQKIPLTPEDVSSPVFQAALTASSVHFNKNSQLTNLHSLVRYAHATKQLVAGVLFEYYALFAETVCENTPENLGKGIEKCAPGNSTKTFICHYKVLFKAWATPKYTVLNEFDCKTRN